MKFIDVLAAVLLVIGGLNWGLYAFADLDLVASTGPLANPLYALVALSALWQVFALRGIQRRWNVVPAAVR